MGPCAKALKLVSQASGGNYTPMSQAYEIALHKLWHQRQGVCLGMSCVWLAAAHDGLRFGIFKHRHDTWELISSIQATADKTSNDLVGNWYVKSWAAAWSRVGFRYGDVHKSRYIYDTLGEYIAKREGCYLVVVPSHATAACYLKGKYCFMDPNAGEVSFTKSLEFSLCLTRYFMHHDVEREYELADDPKTKGTNPNDPDVGYRHNQRIWAVRLD